MSKIFIEVGHGGKDPGAVKNVVEKDVNLKTALFFKEIAERNKFEVKLSRETDIFVDLNTSAKMANDWNADIVIGIHHNAGGGQGYEVIHSVYYGKGTILAQYIGKEFANIGQNIHGIGLYSKPNSKGGDYFCTIRDTKAPAVITEYAYVDSSDSQDIDSDEDLKKEAVALCKACCNYFGKAYDEEVLSEPEDELSDILKTLAEKIQIDQNYWLLNAVEGKQIEGKYIAIIFKRMREAGLI